MNFRTMYPVMLFIGLAVFGCEPDGGSHDTTPGKITLYCSVDEAFARGVLNTYRARTGVVVSVVFDSEAGKTTGLVNRIISEARAGRTRADVFWSSELFNTIRLARLGLLEAYAPPAASDIPERYRDARHRWTAVALRARVIAFDPSRVNEHTLPTRWEDIARREFAPRTSLANPLFGTTRGHLAAMFALWGRERGRTFLTQLREAGVRIVDGNSSAVRALIQERVTFACTDSDDVRVANKHGARLELCYPDMGDGGTLLIPCSVALIMKGPGGDAAKSLVDFLVSAEVERMLALSDSGNIPVREKLRRELKIKYPPETQVNFDAVADAMDEAVAAAREILLR